MTGTTGLQGEGGGGDERRVDRARARKWGDE